MTSMVRTYTPGRRTPCDEGGHVRGAGTVGNCGHGTRHSEHGGSREGFSGSPPCVPRRSQGWNTALSKVHASHGDGLGAGALSDPRPQQA